MINEFMRISVSICLLFFAASTVCWSTISSLVTETAWSRGMALVWRNTRGCRISLLSISVLTAEQRRPRTKSSLYPFRCPGWKQHHLWFIIFVCRIRPQRRWPLEARFPCPHRLRPCFPNYSNCGSWILPREPRFPCISGLLIEPCV